ncbi:uncharacterized protein F4822DRAFT_440397 [Hypoxylon trugodes]|uniref:uncharacterized protein n=1 Tax=Hypoxylon trugodes TaxID=326681 RepID=UPI002192BACD|nr:uncharacterized protein F4822DRAFT_440397 [Hypoxylon trugodes]KAI1384291.1 hypothetical protein F4822DRAFT_440397 [Hypoxylon trugodes]
MPYTWPYQFVLFRRCKDAAPAPGQSMKPLVATILDEIHTGTLIQESGYSALQSTMLKSIRRIIRFDFDRTKIVLTTTFPECKRFLHHFKLSEEEIEQRTIRMNPSKDTALYREVIMSFLEDEDDD